MAARHGFIGVAGRVSKLYVSKVSRGARVGLVPADEASQAAMNRLGEGECVSIELLRPRSLPMHRRLFAILTAIGENCDPPRDPEDVLDELKILAGHYEVMHLKTKAGETYEIRRPKSIAFHRLSHDQFMELWPSLESAGIERFGAEFWEQAW
jgi:hypothetical protein